MKSVVYQSGGAKSGPKRFGDRGPDMAAMIGSMHAYECGADHGDGQ
jgi:hypothetical protein